jgi:hypothetical protein
MNARMTARDRMVWEQAVRVLRQNSVTTTATVELPGAQRVLAKRPASGRLRGGGGPEKPLRGLQTAFTEGACARGQGQVPVSFTRALARSPAPGQC